MNTDNRRIAKNTIIVYINIVVNTVVGLFTSRLVLQALGISDLGLYNVVGGVVAFCTFILSSLSVTTARFINFEMGKQDGDINKVFNVCNTLHITLAILILLISEVIGVWYIGNVLNVDPGKQGDAMFVFQVSIIVSCIGVTNTPFVSLFNSHENFLFSAIVNIGLLLLQLILVVLLLYYDGNKLRVYALMMSISTLISFVVYHYFCHRYWPDIIKWKFVRDKGLYRQALTFNNYNLLSTAAIMGRSQGAAMLINYFFNTAVNGAFAISRSVEKFVLMLSANYDKAAAPQIMQNYSSGNRFFRLGFGSRHYHYFGLRQDQAFQDCFQFHVAGLPPTRILLVQDWHATASAVDHVCCDGRYLAMCSSVYGSPAIPFQFFTLCKGILFSGIENRSYIGCFHFFEFPCKCG